VTFEEAELAAMAAAEEVDIETRSPSGELRRTIIWIVERDGTVYVRSYRGARGRWYREAVADPDSVAACSAGLAEKYAGDPSTPAMLAADVLPTTLKLVPA
jgi:hypothetical protein